MNIVLSEDFIGPRDTKLTKVVIDHGRESVRVPLSEGDYELLKYLLETYPANIPLKTLSHVLNRRPDGIKQSIRKLRLLVGDERFIIRDNFRPNGYRLNPLDELGELG